MDTNNNQPATNIGLAIWRLKCFYETFVQGSTVVILLNFCTKNPPIANLQIVRSNFKIYTDNNETYNITFQPFFNNTSFWTDNMDS